MIDHLDRYRCLFCAYSFLLDDNDDPDECPTCGAEVEFVRSEPTPAFWADGSEDDYL